MKRLILLLLQKLLRLAIGAFVIILATSPPVSMICFADSFDRKNNYGEKEPNIQLGPRPFYLVEKLNSILGAAIN